MPNKEHIQSLTIPNIANSCSSRDIMRDNMLVNVSGLKGHLMLIDLNIEHLIGELKNLLSAKGLQSRWDRLGNISTAIDYLKKIKKQVGLAMSTAYQGTTHTKADTTHLVWCVADKNRKGNGKAVTFCDILALGEKKLKSSSLATFNRKVITMVECCLYTSEPSEDTDTLPPLAMGCPSDALVEVDLD
ncbi:uncharacterized protein LACBIDRAFT_331822 [Laccaria bicolor S238N-H82]|uniref:Predicted protein n=1 Tax=Laccaria bicolor (strain S238N-H82 / ATCC MYA-4686) TaxID=486041 RepID=B0DQP3_LACBS|nr:uncharacterized protein LACBIDRAFT_331822 [Laccaria bicolor S238N-H82]EDR03149.1 predicted protein [Laccaria bicolor S238N-H82]|eukprot:XP_001886290.1 predicted protein [Laccaria bicolor S238N-H82]